MIALARRAGSTIKPSFLRVLSGLSENHRGSIGIIAAVSLLVLLGFGGLAVDVSLWLRAKNSVQGAADAAASSAAAAAVVGNTSSRKLAEAREVAAANGYQNGANGVAVTLNNPPTSGTHTTSPYAYEVIITALQHLYLAQYFSSAFGLAAPAVQGRAVALIATTPLCILALDTTAASSPNPTPLLTSGSAVLTGNLCDIDANSSSSASIATNGGSSISAQDVNTVGNA
jgi:hypothetical protein